MGPLLNPLYWLAGLINFAVAMCAAIVVGTIAYVVGLLLAKRKLHNRALGASLPIAVAIATMPVVFCLIFGSLCQWSLSGSPGPRRKPAREDIVGTWTLTPSSLQRMQEEGNYDISTHTLTFKEDGTFMMINMPDWWLNFGESAGGFDTGSGTWETVKDQGDWTIRVQFTSLPGYRDGLITYFNLGEREPPYYVYLFVGDPDSGRVMVFERQ